MNSSSYSPASAIVLSTKTARTLSLLAMRSKDPMEWDQVRLCELHALWCYGFGLEHVDAEEQLASADSPMHREWLTWFIEMWNEVVG